MLALGTSSIRLFAQVASLPNFEPGPADRTYNWGTPDTTADEQSDNGAPPAGELESKTGGVFIIPGVVNLSDLAGAGVLFGGGFSEGYGWVHGNPAGERQGSLSVVAPYLGAYQGGHRHRLLLEYSPTVDLYNQNKWDGSVLQRGSLRGYRALSERWNWIFSGYSTYGTEYLRELSSVAVGVYPGWLTFSSPTDTRLLTSATTSVNWHRKPRQEFSLAMSDTFSSVDHGPNYDAGVARLQMTNYAGRDSNWYVYAQSRRHSDQPGCTWVGGGGGFIWNMPTRTTVSLEGGPEVGTGHCIEHVTAVFGGSLAQHFSPWTVFYVSATRDLVEPYVLQSRWTDIFTAKLLLKTSHSTDVSTGAGYVRSSNLPGQTESRYRGFMAFSEFRWRVSESFSFVGSYRYFKRDAGNPGFHDRHSWVFASLVWHPEFHKH